VSSEPFDLAVLDVMLPGRSGIEMLSAMRSQGVKIPVLLLTAKDTLADRVLGLDAGADDYLVKPFAFPELSARIRALLRRGRSESVSADRGPMGFRQTSRPLGRFPRAPRINSVGRRRNLCRC
jgi:DNA-binding response OmpR family regulator